MFCDTGEDEHSSNKQFSLARIISRNPLESNRWLKQLKPAVTPSRNFELEKFQQIFCSHFFVF